MWAIKMLDASAKLPSGFLQGGLPMFGSFDQCLAIDADPASWSSTHNHTQPIRGQYCSIVLGPAAPPNTNLNTTKVAFASGGVSTSLGPMMDKLMYFRFDVCLPTSCSKADITKALKHYVKTDSFGIALQVMSCQKDEPVSFTRAQVASITVFSILGLLLLVGTSLDVGLQLLNHFWKDGILDKFTVLTWVKILTSFSFYTNGVKLLATNISSDSLAAVNGIRFLSMSWVILGHCYAYVSFAILGNLLIMDDLVKNFAIQAVLNGFLAVDSFFFLSGLLLAYITIKELRKGGRLNAKFFGMFYFHRFYRLTPAVMLTILFVILWPKIGAGPGWVQATQYNSDSCSKNWWVNLLYIQNLYTKNLCMNHSWYLADDMQFYIISPIILISLYLNRYIGLALNFAFLLTSLITPGVLSAINEFPATILMSDLSKMQSYYNTIYVTPWCRMGPFCIGIFLGYFLALRRDYKVPRSVLAIGWCVAIACNMAVLYGIYPWNSGRLPTQPVADFYSSTHRTVWAAGLAWVTFTCATGHGGIVNRILSWEPFGPLGRMTYMAYLFHPFVQFTYSGMMRERVIYTHYLYVVLFLGFMVVSYGVAFVTSLAFEAPFLALEKILFRRPSSDQKRTSVTFKTNIDQGTVNGGLDASPETVK